jgi:hypothetical protein
MPLRLSSSIPQRHPMDREPIERIREAGREHVVRAAALRRQSEEAISCAVEVIIAAEAALERARRIRAVVPREFLGGRY